MVAAGDSRHALGHGTLVSVSAKPDVLTGLSRPGPVAAVPGARVERVEGGGSTSRLTTRLETPARSRSKRSFAETRSVNSLVGGRLLQ